MKDFWNKRYSGEGYVYGKNPNEYLRERLEELPPGKILFPAEGEGRNAVYAASRGWEVSAFDISEEGRDKAIKLADEAEVEINYLVEELEEIGYKEDSFDVIALIFAHFSSAIRENYFQYFDAYLKKGGLVIFEGFSKAHLEYQKKDPEIGGPREADFLYTEKELRKAFSSYEFLEFSEPEVDLNEGELHQGKGRVIRFVARKII